MLFKSLFQFHPVQYLWIVLDQTGSWRIHGPFSFLQIIIALMKEIFLISHSIQIFFMEQAVEFAKKK